MPQGWTTRAKEPPMIDVSTEFIAVLMALAGTVIGMSVSIRGLSIYP